MGCSLSHHTWPRTPTSTVHINCWRRISRQWAVACQPSAQRPRPGGGRKARKVLTDVETQDVICVFEGAFATLVVVVEVVIQGLSEQILEPLRVRWNLRMLQRRLRGNVSGAAPRYWPDNRPRICRSIELDPRRGPTSPPDRMGRLRFCLL